jgi:hypothetical protein
MTARYLTLLAVLVLAAPVVPLGARQSWGQPGSYPVQAYSQAAYNEGFERGQRAGEDDWHHGRAFSWADRSEYRRADFGYRSDSGERDRYRDQFRIGFEAGYRVGFRVEVRWDSRAGAPWVNGGAFGRERDAAFDRGYNDGYEKGLNSGRHGHRNEPYREGWYRDGSRGYERWYGPRDAYAANYREGFVSG